ncbi:MAG TPA: alpha-amylase family glycosyl hydrolase, partial [Anaerolineaceae bacterium]|nr:alpha-amylase family glycosyl hydrolase [Anaerolineaceae bacterium]
MQGLKWWQTAVFYQIYPRSFADSNGDGIGDLGGILAKLDYLQDLGVDAIWLSPHFPSPQVDWGYDVADYYGVAAEYGTPEQFRVLLDEIHRRGMYLIIDLVLNHTSDQHPWFLESKSSQDNPKRDWYVWREGKGAEPPNNWYSTFGGNAWRYDPSTGEWYYHFFFKEQPDLNWRNPDVKQAMFDMVRYWLDFGVDGFRLDAIGTIFEHAHMPDYEQMVDLDDLYRMERLAKGREEQMAITRRKHAIFHHQYDQPEVHALMRELRALVDEYPDRVLVGETDDLEFYGNGRDELHLVFNFPLMRTDRITPAWVRANQEERLSGMPAGAWPCNTLGNHDTSRMLTHFCPDGDAQAAARLNLALLLTLWGTPFLYNGEEIGMSDAYLTRLEQFRDPLSLYAYKMERTVMQAPHNEALHHAALRGRDKCRTPFQWSDAPNAGFCPPEVTPWLPVNPDAAEGVNVSR